MHNQASHACPPGTKAHLSNQQLNILSVRHIKSEGLHSDAKKHLPQKLVSILSVHVPHKQEVCCVKLHSRWSDGHEEKGTTGDSNATYCMHRNADLHSDLSAMNIGRDYRLGLLCCACQRQ